MKKYLHLYKISVQDMFSDAGKTFIWILIGAAESFVTAFIWTTASQGQQTVGSMALSDLITYYSYLFITWYIIGGNFYHIISNSIRLGELSSTLIKPIFPYAKDILLEQGWKTFGLISGVPLLILFLIAFAGNIHIVFSPANFLISIPAIILSTLAFALIQFIIGNCAHWFQRTHGLYAVYSTASYILGGGIAPLVLMPELIQKIAYILPFRYTFAFPIEIFQGLIHSKEVMNGFLIQCLWIMILVLVCKILYKKGLQRYESYGQ